jgi:hypothetical protein
MVNLDNINNIRSLFGVSKMTQGGISRFESGSIIMIRDVGLDLETEDFNDLNIARKEQDLQHREDIVSLLNQGNVKFTEDNLYVLAQPQFYEENLYWESIKDCLSFIKKISDSRIPTSGSMLIELFEESLPIIMEIENLDDQNFKFQQYFQA